jgi:gliding motility-associated protein GldE
MEPPSETLLNILLLINSFGLDQILGLLVLVILLVCSGLISGSEVAFFSIVSKELDDLKTSTSRGDQTTALLLERPKLLLATILIANNFINVGIVILSTALTASIFDFGDNHILGFIFQVIVITFLILLFGEVLPKVYAVQNRLKLTSFMSLPILWLRKVFYPVSISLVRATSFIDRRFERRVENISVDNLTHALELTTDETTGEEEKRILEGIVNFGNTDVRQIMISRVDVFALDVSEDYNSVKEQIVDAGFSRIPVYNGNFDKIEGVLYVKDLLPHLDGPPDFKWQELVRPPFFVPENKKIDDLLNEIQERKIHLVIVVDEYGGTSGIATLEDIIEEIVGDISDEFDDDDITYSKLDEQNYIFEGKTTIKDFCRIVDADESIFDEAKGDSETLAGFIIELSGRIPEKKNSVEFEGFTFVVEAADQRKISTLKVTLPEPEEVEEEDEGSEL